MAKVGITGYRTARKAIPALTMGVAMALDCVDDGGVSSADGGLSYPDNLSTLILKSLRSFPET